MAEFTQRIPVMFQHCDPAGIVFYPRYYEMINAVIETFFGSAGWSFARMHAQERVGVPAARIDAEFRAPSRLGDVLDWRLAVARAGGASVDLRLDAACAGEARLTARATLVFVGLDTVKSRRWPEDLKATFEQYKEDAA
ncbi:acyl-CoA thioesterase [Roseivivax sp. CAU 1761]